MPFAGAMILPLLNHPKDEDEMLLADYEVFAATYYDALQAYDG